MLEMFNQEVEEHTHLGDALRTRGEHGEDGGGLCHVLADKKLYELAGSDRVGDQEVGEAGDAPAFQGQLQNALQAIAGEGGGHLQVLQAAVGGPEGPAVATWRGEDDAAVVHEVRTRLRDPKLLDVAGAGRENGLDFRDLA